ncbi:Uncharacterised protein [Yersinia mollaretii]|uniref:hypothetical protein n=1 Tax=Yersinia mollaretii TaxID=33060 RepID=UPI0005E3E0BE|nr:hypothetical protein [Yersinia mollaretii]CQR03169.1 Uncharacterised protein [Yersinia mollaretii]
MMDITKSQSDFEAWVVTWWPQSKTMIAEKFDDGGYWNMPLQQYFEVWKASRESIDVELPAKVTANDTHWTTPNKMRESLELALRTAGIRIKGESE